MVSDVRAPLRLRIRGTEEEFDRAPDDLVPGSSSVPDVRPVPVTIADRLAGQQSFEVTVAGWVFEITAEPLARALLRGRAASSVGRTGAGGVQVVKAQIPGRVVRLWVSEGDTVESGQRLLAIEAMKMENEVRATRAGTVETIRVAVDGSVELGDELLTVR